MKTKTIFLTIVLLVIQLTNLQHVLNAMPVIDIANQGSLTSRVSDFSTKQPMEYVTVVLFSAKDFSMVAGTISSKEGTTTSDKRIATERQELTRNNPLTTVHFNASH